MKKIIFATVALFLLLGCEKKDPMLKSQQENFVLTSTNGTNIDVAVKDNNFEFSGFEGKPLLITFFATWCPPCKAEMPELAHLKTEFNGSVNIMAVLAEKDKNLVEVEDFIKEYKINFPVVVSSENFRLASALGGVKGLPSLFLFDSNGTLVKIYPGAVPKELLADDFKKVLKQ